MKDNITLIGMPGVGKSTVGVLLAKKIGYEYADSDLLIQKREKRLLKEIIEQEGDDGFLRIEEDVNASLDVHRTVIAPGGSVIYGPRAMAHLKKISTVVYLYVPYEELSIRLGNLHDRGVVLRAGQTFRDLFEERTLLYERYADVTVSESGLTLSGTLEAVSAAVAPYVQVI